MINVGDSIKMKQSSLARKQIKNIFFQLCQSAKRAEKYKTNHIEKCVACRGTERISNALQYILRYMKIILSIVYIDILIILCLFLTRDCSLLGLNLRNTIVSPAINHMFIRNTIVALGIDHFISFTCLL